MGKFITIPEEPFKRYTFKKTLQYNVRGKYLAEYELAAGGWMHGYAVIIYDTKLEYYGFIEVNGKNHTRWTFTFEHTRKGHGMLKRWQSSEDLHQSSRLAKESFEGRDGGKWLACPSTRNDKENFDDGAMY